MPKFSQMLRVSLTINFPFWFFPKRYRRELRCSHFATLADLLELLESSLLTQNSNNGIIYVYSAHIWLWSIQWNTRALTAVWNGAMTLAATCWCFSVAASGMWEFPPQGLRLRTYLISMIEQMRRRRRPKVFIMEIFLSFFQGWALLPSSEVDCLFTSCSN